jgi:hypothetical protein
MGSARKDESGVQKKKRENREVKERNYKNREQSKPRAGDEEAGQRTEREKVRQRE